MDALRAAWDGQHCKDFAGISTLIFDCDGVLWNVNDPERDPERKHSPVELQQKVVGRVNEIIREGNKRVLFLTNNSHMTRLGFIHKLASMGILFGDLEDPATKERALASIVTAGFTTAKLLKQKGVKRPFVMTSTAGLLEELREVGITDFITTLDESSKDEKQKKEYLAPFDKEAIDALLPAHKDVDAIVMGWDFHLTAMKIGLSVNLLRWSMEGAKPIPLVACSSDSSGVLGTTKDGRKIRAVGNGAMGQAVAQCFDPPLEQITCGKPSSTLLKLLLDPEEAGGYGVNKDSAVMVGDTIETDIVFANEGGLKSLLVLTGVNSLEEMERETDPKRKSTWILPSFADAK